MPYTRLFREIREIRDEHLMLLLLPLTAWTLERHFILNNAHASRASLRFR
jgi:hypothetical protein